MSLVSSFSNWLGGGTHTLQWRKGNVDKEKREFPLGCNVF